VATQAHPLSTLDLLPLIESGDTAAMRRLDAAHHPSDLADALAHLNADERLIFLEALYPESLSEVLTWLPPDLREEVLGRLDIKQVAAAFSELHTDDAVELIADLDDDEQRQVLASMAPADRQALEEGLSYEEETAGRLMQRELVAVPGHWSVGHTIDFLRNHHDLADTFYEIFIVDPKHHPIGTVPLHSLLKARRPTLLADIMHSDFKSVAVSIHHDEVTYLFRHYGLVSLAVTDASGRLAGMITVDDVVDVIDEQTEEDTLRLGGISRMDFYRAAFATSRARFLWLFVNLATAILASSVISLFEGSLQTLVALAVLMPIVASMGGNAGTQTVTVTVRAMALRQLSPFNRRRFIVKEGMVGLFNGSLFALLGGGIAAAWFGDIRLGLVLGAAMVVNLLAATLAGTLIPLGLRRVGADPAVASTVFLTTVTDVVGFFAFLGLATWWLL
jgi:magnesium transporter